MTLYERLAAAEKVLAAVAAEIKAIDDRYEAAAIAIEEAQAMAGLPPPPDKYGRAHEWVLAAHKQALQCSVDIEHIRKKLEIFEKEGFSL